MVRRYSIGRFMWPWLAYAALSGLAVGFILGTIVTIFGLVLGFFMVFNAGTIGNAISEVVKAFPQYALLVLCSIAGGFVAGFINGLISSLVGGAAGYWWSFAFCFGASLYFLQSLYILFSVLPVLWLGAFGALNPQFYLSSKPLRFESEKPLRDWLRNSWLLEPPQVARMSGILLPLALCMAFEVAETSPVFLENKHYAARIGNWTTWQNSKYQAMSSQRRNFALRSNCQANLKQIMLGMMQYTEDYDGYYPPNLTDPAHGVDSAIFPYVRSTYIFQCPAEFYGATNQEFKSGDFTDYWFNARLYNLNESRLTAQSFTVAFGDGNTGMGEANSAYSLRGLPTPFAPSTRHRGGANYAFADGHVALIMPAVISNSATRGGYSFVPQIQVGARQK